MQVETNNTTDFSSVVLSATYLSSGVRARYDTGGTLLFEYKIKAYILHHYFSSTYFGWRSLNFRILHGMSRITVYH